MGYSKSPKTFNGVRQYLDQMLTSEGDIAWSVPEPTRLAFRLREAMHAAHFHEEFRAYRPLKNRFRISTGSSLVRATHKYTNPSIPIPVEATTPETPTLRDLTIPEASSLLAVLGSTAPWPDGVGEIYFPDANLLPPEMERLLSWASETKREVTSHEGAGLTIRSQSQAS